ncbi:MAG: alpha/beta fold hydrolase [Actinobacteria bacterium]|nr:alpha/beta fold hydrolase [Actinomycetota bacterium]
MSQPSYRGFRRWLPISPPPQTRPRPAADRAAALARFEELCATDDARVGEATRTRLFEPSGEALATIVAWHGFTNAPSQFVAVAGALAEQGYRVLVPRQPYQGFTDVLNRSLAELTTQDLIDHVDTCVDIAAGFGDPVWVVGLSAGGVLAAWAAATRGEVQRAILLAPLVAPKGVPMPVVRMLVKFPRIVPGFYYWWDPRVKENLGHSPHAYPGFPVPGLMPYLHLSEAMFDATVEARHQLTRVVLVSNPGDFAIRRDAARSFATSIFAGHADYYGEATVDGDLGWWHDFVDPWSPHRGTTEQVVAVLLAGFGVDDPTAGGVLVPPLLQRQPGG